MLHSLCRRRRAHRGASRANRGSLYPHRRRRWAKRGTGFTLTTERTLCARRGRGRRLRRLGLSIVARIAVLSHAQLELGVVLPRADGGHGFSPPRFGSAAHPVKPETGPAG